MGGMNGFQRTTSTKSLHLLGSHQADWGGQGAAAAAMPGVWAGGNAALGYPLPGQGQFPALVPGTFQKQKLLGHMNFTFSTDDLEPLRFSTLEL
jgi:hypothetical protein